MEGCEALKKFREDRELSLSGLAELLDESKPTVHRWESGARKIGRTKLPKVSSITGIPKRALRPDLAELLEEAAE